MLETSGNNLSQLILPEEGSLQALASLNIFHVHKVPLVLDESSLPSCLAEMLV